MAQIKQDGGPSRCQAVERIEAWPYAKRCERMASVFGVRVPVGDRNPSVVSAQPGLDTGLLLDLCGSHAAEVPG